MRFATMVENGRSSVALIRDRRLLPLAIPDVGLDSLRGLAASGAAGAGPGRPLVYAKLPASVSGHRSVVTWDRSLTANVDAESELGVVIGKAALAVPPEEA